MANMVKPLIAVVIMSFLLNKGKAIFPFHDFVIMSFLINKGLSGNNCSINDINIGTVRSGREIEGKPEWNVTVINNCGCSQKSIKLGCKGFQTAEPVDPLILLKSKEGETCLLINGSSLVGFQSVRFSYAWDPPFLLLPLDSSITC
ncbi:hypothetical protein TIFTF001_014659 [Ficus carica]|uniref:Uncharacterized protein n=1 Tax=Ficus carica TaxID=3494 RepID=A0AA88A4B6_FICCA|nr:hypothetical protein TIFTF001_014659 [Ficus carica]